MASSQSYSDFERDYNTHLSKVRSFLAQPTNNNQGATNDIASCETAIQKAKQCIHAMQGLAEIEGDPFKATEAKRKLERDIGPLEEEIKGRKTSSSSSSGSGILGGFKRTNNNANTNNNRGKNALSSDEKYLFGNNSRTSYAPPTIGGENQMDISDLEMGDNDNDYSLTTPLTTMDQSMLNSEHLLRETQALCAESEQIGNSTLETMGRQREQIERGGNLIQESLQNTEQARAIMKQMAYRALKNKIFLYCIIGLLLLANGAMMLHLWRRK